MITSLIFDDFIVTDAVMTLGMADVLWTVTALNNLHHRVAWFFVLLFLNRLAWFMLIIITKIIIKGHNKS